MMTATVSADAEDAKLTVGLTMTVGEWRQLEREILSNDQSDTLRGLGKMIANVLGEAIGRLDARYNAGPYFCRETEVEA